MLSVHKVLFAGDEIKTQLDAIQKEEVEFDQQYIQWKQQYDDWKKQNESKHYLFQSLNYEIIHTMDLTKDELV